MHVYTYLLDAIYYYAVISLMHTKEGALAIHLSSIVILATLDMLLLNILNVKYQKYFDARCGPNA